jgi:hypothetical protein
VTDTTAGVRIEPLDRDALRTAIADGTPGPAVPDHIRAAIHAGHVGQVVIFCDRCGVEEQGDYTGGTSTVRFNAARAYLEREKGWRCCGSGTQDLCPTCRKEAEGG